MPSRPVDVDRELVLAGRDASTAAAIESAASAGEIDASLETAARLPASAVRAGEDVSLLGVDIERDGGTLFFGSGVPQASEDDEGRMLRAPRRLADAHTPLPPQFGVNRGHVFAAELGAVLRAVNACPIPGVSAPRPCRQD